ncbi:MAG: diaminopimelate epimerase [bacterium]|nr:diaminopimelate epimerase [bacterium]
MNLKKEYIPFWKLEGTGNDFIFFDRVHLNHIFFENGLTTSLIQQLCDRHFGIGADGVIVLTKSERADFKMNYWNADGSMAGMCGNGLRCTMHFAVQRGHCQTNSATIELPDGSEVVRVTKLESNHYEVEMPTPKFESPSLPTTAERIETTLLIDGEEFTGIGVDVKNPHFVIPVPETNRQLAERVGKKIEVHPRFPNKTNVEFVKLSNRREVELWVWERGCGITLACGSGATATVAALVKKNLLDTNVPIQVHLPGGTLKVTMADDLQKVHLSGPANIVYYGFWEIEKGI